MTDEKEPSKEALAVAQHIEVPYEGMADVNFALALDAWGEALLKRQEQAELQVFVDFKRDLAAEKAAHTATRAELEATRKDLAMSREELDRAHSIIAAHVDAAESLRRPLEGELAEDVEELQQALILLASDYGEQRCVNVRAALSRIEAALRAKGEPQAAEPPEPLRSAGVAGPTPCPGCGAERGIHADQACSCKPQEPRPIVVEGSEWRCNHHGMKALVEQVAGDTVHMRWEDGERRAWPTYQFIEHFTHVSDPEPAAPAPSLRGMLVTIDDSDPPAAPAPELPRKVEHCDCDSCHQYNAKLVADAPKERP